MLADDLALSQSDTAEAFSVFSQGLRGVTVKAKDGTRLGKIPTNVGTVLPGACSFPSPACKGPAWCVQLVKFYSYITVKHADKLMHAPAFVRRRRRVGVR